MLPEIVASVGLALDIVGVLLIWKFSLGRPMIVKGRDGTDHEIYSGKSEKKKLYKALDYLGFVLLILGFLLQIAANWIPENYSG